jgi:hypothetical protein
MGLIKSVIKSNNFEFRDIFEDVKRFKNETLLTRNFGDNKGEGGDKQDSEFLGQKKSDPQGKDGSPRAQEKNNKTQIINVKEANSSLEHAAKNLSEHKQDFIEKAPRGKNNENSEFYSMKKDDSITESFNIPQTYKNLTENKSGQAITETQNNLSLDPSKNLTIKTSEIETGKSRSFNQIKDEIKDTPLKINLETVRIESGSESMDSNEKLEDNLVNNKKLEFVQKHANKIIAEPVIKFIIRFISYCLKNIDSRTISEFVVEIKEVANTTATKQENTTGNDQNTGSHADSLLKNNKSSTNLGQNSNNEEVESISHNSQQFLMIIVNLTNSVNNHPILFKTRFLSTLITFLTKEDNINISSYHNAIDAILNMSHNIEFYKKIKLEKLIDV